MEKKKYDLCLEILRRLKTAEVLDKLILVGSWCVPLYADYFKGKGNLPAIRTRDIEFLIPLPPKLTRRTDLCDLLKDLGFVIDHKGEQGYIILEHPDLILEFLVPARGRETAKPYPLPLLGINAQPLRFMDLLAQDTIRALFGTVEVRLPHPANFAFQKLLIARRRPDKTKAERDRVQAAAVLNAIRLSRDFETARNLFHSLPRLWRRTIRLELTNVGEDDLVNLLEEPRSG